MSSPRFAKSRSRVCDKPYSSSACLSEIRRALGRLWGGLINCPSDADALAFKYLRLRAKKGRWLIKLGERIIRIWDIGLYARPRARCDTQFFPQSNAHIQGLIRNRNEGIRH